MSDREAFPLITGRLSLDLVNTEVVRWGKRIDLLLTPADLTRWTASAEQAGGLVKESLPADFATGDALRSLRELRAFLRRGFERVASGTALSDRELKEDWISPLEALVQKAPLAYRVIGNALIPVPQGAPADALAALTALDALRLVSTGALSTVRRCANPHCVLLFLDSSGRRKWCSMRLCGNRMKVARHQSRKGLVRKE